MQLIINSYRHPFFPPPILQTTSHQQHLSLSHLPSIRHSFIRSFFPSFPTPPTSHTPFTIRCSTIPSNSPIHISTQQHTPNVFAVLINHPSPIHSFFIRSFYPFLPFLIAPSILFAIFTTLIIIHFLPPSVPFTLYGV